MEDDKNFLFIYNTEFLWFISENCLFDYFESNNFNGVEYVEFKDSVANWRTYLK